MHAPSEKEENEEEEADEEKKFSPDVLIDFRQTKATQFHNKLSNG